MKYYAHALSGPQRCVVIANVAFDKLDPVSDQRKILAAPSNKIIQRPHSVAAFDQRFGYMRADESRSSSHQIQLSISHVEVSFLYTTACLRAVLNTTAWLRAALNTTAWLRAQR